MGKILYFSSLSSDERRMIIDYLFKDVDFIKNVLLEYSHSKRFKEFLLLLSFSIHLQKCLLFALSPYSLIQTAR